MSADNGETVSMVLQYATVKSRLPDRFFVNWICQGEFPSAKSLSPPIHSFADHDEVLQIIMTLDLQQGADRKVQISMSLMSGQVISTVEAEHSMRLYELRRALFQHVSAFSRLEKETMKFCTTSGRMVHLRGSATVHSLLVNPLKRPRAN
ncbi:unnamed protein product [Symbiodinium natans]|uniref:Uncharacterized protein n=1 Tax=Symbiodinium natans TaxID=878477 RepID=A0A812L540_9DINO|nr:unnamed protein product [Symbiodinium natans]